MTRSPLRLLVLAMTALSAALVVAGPAQGAAPSCGITWGSLAKHASAGAGGQITNVRAGRHDCYDRLVIDLRGSAAPYDVAYVKPVTEDPSGRPVALRGGAFLQITLQSPDHTPDGVPTYRPAHPRELVDVTGFSTFRQVAQAGSFENVTTYGLGVRARLPFRVFTINSGGIGRVVVDVAHSW